MSSSQIVYHNMHRIMIGMALLSAVLKIQCILNQTTPLDH